MLLSQVDYFLDFLVLVIIGQNGLGLDAGPRDFTKILKF